MARIVLFLLGIGFGLQAQAVGYFFPQGQREALMGNVGLALNGSEGASIYNPAGLATLEASRISISGSLLNASQMKTALRSNAEFEARYDANNEDLSFSQIPGLVAGYSQTSYGLIGYFLSSDLLVSFDKFYTMESQYLTYYTIFKNTQSSLLISGAWANKTTLSERWSLQYGITLGVAMLDWTSQSNLKWKNNFTGTYTSSFDTTTAKTINAVARAGVLLDSSESAYGFYIQPKGVRLSSSYSKFSYSVSTDGTVEDNSTAEGPDRKTPMSVGLGVAFKKWEKWKLFYDVNYSEVKEDLEEESAGRLNTTISQGLGFEYLLKPTTSIFSGLTSSKDRKGDNSSEGLLWSGGFNYTLSFLKNYVGLYASENRGEMGTKLILFGLMLGTQYSY